MDISIALRIIAGLITEDNVNWFALGYDPHRFDTFGTPDWNDVKLKAVETLEYYFDRLGERMERLESLRYIK